MDLWHANNIKACNLFLLSLFLVCLLVEPSLSSEVSIYCSFTSLPTRINKSFGTNWVRHGFHEILQILISKMLGLELLHLNRGLSGRVESCLTLTHLHRVSTPEHLTPRFILAHLQAYPPQPSPTYLSPFPPSQQVITCTSTEQQIFGWLHKIQEKSALKALPSN